MSKRHFIMREVKIFDENGEVIAQSVADIPLEKGECELCAAEFFLKMPLYNPAPVWHKKPSGKTIKCEQANIGRGYGD
jgi:hypothetical protein